MIPTFSDVIRALADCRESFDRLRDIRPAGGERFSRTSFFAEFEVEWQGCKWLLCTPLAEDAVRRVENTALRLGRERLPHVAEYRVYHSEMRFFDSAGGEHRSDVVMQRLPDGTPLSRLTDRRGIREELTAMRDEFLAAGFSHNNLKPENIIATNIDGCKVIRPHFATFDAADGDARAFELLFETFPAEAGCDMELHDSAAGGYDCPASEYDEIWPEYESLRRVRRGSLYGFIDDAGRETIEVRFDHATDFEEGRAMVGANGRTGLIDTTGAYVIPPLFPELEYSTENGISIAGSAEQGWTAFDYDGRQLDIRAACIGDARRMAAEHIENELTRRTWKR
ncbi:MAG: WG repeat-containing protein [Alistipes sp.]|nr:WG repeat-containing protein [Alistipes sp.]